MGPSGDHPRVCGEKPLDGCGAFWGPGSPPRVRGKVDAATLTLKARGITPACAGKSTRSQSAYNSAVDHPRVCGEKPACTSRWSAGPGITPACAGKSCRSCSAAAERWDHPRVCGEKFCLNVIPNSIKGSPPRVRGKARFLAAPAMLPRITPACAGKRTTS